MPMKFMPAAVVADPSLGDRQIRVVANSGKSDRVGDVLVAKGCMLQNYSANPIVLANHDISCPVGNFAPEIKDRVEGVISFAPAGISAKADEYCALYKAGVLRAVSVGFDPIEAIPNKAGGITYERWELMELSCTAVPCDAGAIVIGRDGNALASKAEGASWKCGASRNLPLGGDNAWDGPAAEKSIFEKASFDGDDPDLSFARKGFLAYDSANPKLKGSYKLPFAKVIDGRLTAMPSGVRAAASRLPQADIPEDVQTKGRAVLDSYESKMDGDGDGKGAGRRVVKGKPKIKGLYDVAQLAALLGELGWIQDMSKWEADVEQDESKMPAMLAAALKNLADCLIAMTQEETAELLAGRDVEPILPMDDYILAAPTPIAKKLRAVFRKAGRVFSQANQDHLDALTKCIGKMADCHVKAADLHDDMHDALLEMQQHIEETGEHVKAMNESADGKKPSGGDGDQPGDEPENADTELAAQVAHRKRLAAALALADAP